LLFRELTNESVCVAVEHAEALEASACQGLIDWSEQEGFRRARIRQGDGVALDEAVRVAEEVLFDPSRAPPPVTELVRRLGGLVADVNRCTWRFDITRLSEAGVIRYSPGHHFLLHTDLVPEHPERKLGIVVQLSDATAYGGGDLEYGFSPPRTASRARGTLIVFPSWMPHRVSPVTEGRRYSLALFAIGPSFR
jgi:PKHD-type hydroxylase